MCAQLKADVSGKRSKTVGEHLLGNCLAKIVEMMGIKLFSFLVFFQI